MLNEMDEYKHHTDALRWESEVELRSFSSHVKHCSTWTLTVRLPMKRRIKGNEECRVVRADIGAVFSL